MEQQDITLTETAINSLRPGGVFTVATMFALGYREMPRRGWVRELHGKKISQAKYDAALAGVGIHRQSFRKLALEVA